MSTLVTPAIAGMSLIQPFLMKIIDDHIVAQTAEGLYTAAGCIWAVFGTYLLVTAIPWRFLGGTTDHSSVAASSVPAHLS